MAFTAADLVLLDEAIRAVMTGERVIETRMSDRMTRYADLSLSDLLKLREQIVPLLPVGSTRRPRIYRATHSKGL